MSDVGEVCTDGGRRAAAYARMSTDTQDMSIALQLDYIARYAAGMQYRLVQVYRDEGKSGLTLRHRAGLRQLLADVASGAHGFELLLIYDVSRWGRFADIDESACYEFLCTLAGVEVVYCAELFGQEAAPLQHLMKDIKRLMAAERSRELSVRVFEAHAYLLKRGYKAGGVAGYGLRRLGVRADGTVRGVLADGERKGHPTDRVKLVPGPENEVSVVQQIFRCYVEQGMSYAALARHLNERGVVPPSGSTWQDVHVRAVLTNEKYCGNLLYNRTTGKLRTPRRRNQPGEWLCCDHAHAPIVTPTQYAQAQAHYGRRRGIDADAVLAALRELYLREGRLSYRLIERSRGMPHVALLKTMFGSLEQVYRLALAGTAWPPAGMAHSCVWRLAGDLRQRVCACIDEAGHSWRPTRQPNIVLLDEVWTLRIAVVSCARRGDYWGWRVPAQAAGSDFVICGLRGRGDDQILRYVLLGRDGLYQQYKWVGEQRPVASTVVVADELQQLFGLA